jgi:hypothetical protein
METIQQQPSGVLDFMTAEQLLNVSDTANKLMYNEVLVNLKTSLLNKAKLGEYYFVYNVNKKYKNKIIEFLKSKDYKIKDDDNSIFISWNKNPLPEYM